MEEGQICVKGLSQLVLAAPPHPLLPSIPVPNFSNLNVNPVPNRIQQILSFRLPFSVAS
jgi:hypothetical protein